MMGAFQGAFAKIVGGAMAGKMLEEKRKQSLQNVEDVKLAKLKQRALKAKYKAQIEKSREQAEKSKLAKITAKQKTAELKAKQKGIYIGGQLVTDPNLIKTIEKGAKLK